LVFGTFGSVEGELTARIVSLGSLRDLPRTEAKGSHASAHRNVIVIGMLVLASIASPVGIFLNWGIFSIQLGNLIVIVAMFVLFVLALVLPFPGGRRGK
jgi:cadmium resistance protein CadD (predicted permease)